MARTCLRVLALALTASALSSSAALAAWPHVPTVNVPVVVGAWTKQREVAVANGSGGIYVAWEDYRSGTARIYAQHLLSDGTVASGWGPNGNEVKTASPARALTTPAICSDDAGGAVIVWDEAFSVSDHDIYAQRMTPNGVPLWGSSGLPVANSTIDQFSPVVVDDGLGNTLFAWLEDHSGGGTALDVYANRMGPNGAVRWGSTGVILCNATGDQSPVTAVSDGASGLDAAWVDHRGAGAIDATRRDSSGVLHSGWTAKGARSPPEPTRSAHR